MTVDYCNLLSTERKYRLLLEVVTKVLATQHCTVDKQSTPETPETTTTRRNRFSALYSKSESNISDYHSAKEKSPNRTEDRPHPEVLTPEEDKFNPLASPTIIKGVKPLQPQPENQLNPFQKLLSEILATKRNSK